MAIGVGSWLGYRAREWKEVKIVVQMEMVFTILGGLAGLYAALVTGAPVFNWPAIAVFVIFAVTWIVLYRQVLD